MITQNLSTKCRLLTTMPGTFHFNTGMFHPSKSRTAQTSYPLKKCIGVAVAQKQVLPSRGVGPNPDCQNFKIVTPGLTPWPIILENLEVNEYWISAFFKVLQLKYKEG